MPTQDLTEGRTDAQWLFGAQQLYYDASRVPDLQRAVQALRVQDQIVFVRWYLDGAAMEDLKVQLDLSGDRIVEEVHKIRELLWTTLGKPDSLLAQEAQDRSGSLGMTMTAPNTSPLPGKGKKRDWQMATKAVIIIPTILYILYDFVAYFMAGGEATLSTTTGNWLVKSFWIVLAMGLLVGHLMGSATEAQISWRHGAVLVAGLLLGYLLTVMATS